MTKETFKRAKEIDDEIKYITTERLPILQDTYEEIVEYRDKGCKEIDGDFCFDVFSVNAHLRSATFTIENVINFLKAEIKTMTEYKESLEKELKEL